MDSGLLSPERRATSGTAAAIPVDAVLMRLLVRCGALQLHKLTRLGAEQDRSVRAG